MGGFDAASFWAGLGLGLAIRIALACFTRAQCRAGLPSAGRPYNVNPPASASIRPEVPPKAPPPPAQAKRHLTVELRQRPPRGPDFGPDLRR